MSLEATMIRGMIKWLVKKCTRCEKILQQMSDCRAGGIVQDRV